MQNGTDRKVVVDDLFVLFSIIRALQVFFGKHFNLFICLFVLRVKE